MGVAQSSPYLMNQPNYGGVAGQSLWLEERYAPGSQSETEEDAITDPPDPEPAPVPTASDLAPDGQDLCSGTAPGTLVEQKELSNKKSCLLAEQAEHASSASSLGKRKAACIEINQLEVHGRPATEQENKSCAP